MATTTSDGRSLGELFSSLSKDTTTLVRQEIELAKAEISEKVSEAGRSVVVLAVGGMIAYAALIMILAAVAIGLAQVMSPWLATLIVGVVVAIVGLILVSKGINTLKNLSFVPKKTLQTLKEDKEWAQQQVQEMK